MQPARDSNDRRYWGSDRPGSQGAGFTKHRDKRQSPHYARQRSMEVSTVGTGKGRTADAVRARSRDLYEALLDRIQERIESADTFTLSELSQAANVAGRIGLGGDDARDSAVTIRIVRDELPMPTPLPTHTYSMLPTHDSTGIVVPMLNSGNELDYADTVARIAYDQRVAEGRAEG